MSATAEQLAKLAEPIPASRVSQRQGNRLHQGECSKAYKSAPCTLRHNNLDYITARVAMERLDDVVGPACWQDQYEDRADGSVRGGIGILTADAGWVWKWDVGVESDMEADKGSYSDAFKRAAVKWGIARELYPEVGRALRSDEARRQHSSAPAVTPSTAGASTEEYASGKVVRGRAPVDMSLRQTPDGYAFGFALEETIEGREHPRKTQVLVTDALAEVMAKVWDNPAEADVWGQLVMVPWDKDGKAMPPYRRIVASRVMTPEWTLPAQDAAPVPAVEEKTDDLDKLPF